MRAAGRPSQGSGVMADEANAGLDKRYAEASSISAIRPLPVGAAQAAIGIRGRSCVHPSGLPSLLKHLDVTRHIA